jgi:hypothetical protein
MKKESITTLAVSSFAPVLRIIKCARSIASLAILGMVALFAGQAKATPYASCITNNAGSIQFYLNESNATICVTYEDGSTNASFDGINTGTNQLKGLKSFTLGSHSSYTITVTKNGSGSSLLLATYPINNAGGVDVNKLPNSRFFGQVYAASRGGQATSLRRLYADMTANGTNGGGVAWTTSTSEPYRLAVNDDGYLTVGSFASANSGVWRIDPTLSTNQLLLGPPGDTAGAAANSHGSIFSRPLLIGNLQSGGSAVLYQVDAGNFAFNSLQLNSILVYSNITLGTLPRNTVPDLLGPATGLNLVLNNNFPGLTVGPNGYFYCSNRRDVTSKANVQVYDQNFNLVWDSVSITGGSSDIFIPTASAGISAVGLGDGAVSPDGKFYAGVGISDNHISIIALTNGIPDASTIYHVANTNTTTQSRGICWDAADNVYVSSSGAGVVQQWTLGLSAKAVTKGDVTGVTNFALILPATQVSVTATTPFASQSGPTAGVFTITRNSAVSSDTNAPLTVFYTLTGTATNGSYAVSGGTTTSVTFAPGQNSTNITITPINDGVSRPTTTVILTIAGNGNYSSLAPVSATISIQNIGPQLVFISSAPGATMYKGLTNDYGSFVVTRWGDTNAATYTVSNFTYAGVATTNVQVLPAQAVTFNPGDINVTNISMTPLIDTTNYVGNKSITLGLASGGGYTAGTNKVILTIIDNANLPATVLWANPLTDPADAANWAVMAANNDMLNVGLDTSVEFGYDLTINNPNYTANGLIPLPPSGATNCLRVTVNKNNNRATGVNLYPTNVTFSGNYAVRFAMNIAEGSSPSFTTEGPMFGINHTGLYTNWWSGSAILSGWDISNTSSNWTSDGIWYWVAADGGATAGDYIEKSGLGGTNGNAGWVNIATAARTTLGNVFKNPAPYSTLNGSVPASGLPANSSPVNGLSGGYTNAWADVEIKTINKKVTLSINKNVIFTYNNTNSVWTNGTIMLGYNDPFSSVGGLDGAVYFSDIKVVSLGAPSITSQPTNLVLAVGTTAAYSVGTSYDSSAANTNGQWLFNGAAIAGATNNTYSFTVTNTSYGTYSWTNFDGNYALVSSNATLRPPTFTIVTNPLANVVVAFGTVTNLTSAANSFSGTTNYQWQSSSTNIPGATSRIYNFTAGGTNYGTFRVIINDGWNFATSSVASVLPPTPGVLAPLPSSRAAVVGSSPSLTVFPSTFSGITNVQWLLASVPVSATVGGTSRTLTLTNIQPVSYGSYTVRVNDGFTSVTSSPAALVTVAVSQTISSPSRTGNSFKFSFGTEVGPSYVSEFKTNLLQTNWSIIQTNAGTGGTISVTNISNADTVFYRIRLQ